MLVLNDSETDTNTVYKGVKSIGH